MPIVSLHRMRKVRLATGVELWPGDNKLPAEAWDRVADHPVTQLYLNRGELTVRAGGKSTADPAQANPDDHPPYSPESPPLPFEAVSLPPAHGGPETHKPSKPTTEAADLGSLDDAPSMRARDVIEAINNVDDLRRLRRLLTIETRATVIKAIEHRMDVLRG